MELYAPCSKKGAGRLRFLVSEGVSDPGPSRSLDRLPRSLSSFIFLFLENLNSVKEYARWGVGVGRHRCLGKHADAPKLGKESSFRVVRLACFLEGSQGAGKWLCGVPRNVHFGHQTPTLANNPELKFGTETTVPPTCRDQVMGHGLEGPPQMFCYLRP